MNRSSLFWGAVLLLLGGLMLAGQMGVRLPGGATPMAFFWPLVLIFFGGWMVLSVFMRGKSPVGESASVSLQGASEASVRINHGAGELRIGSGAGMDELANGVFSGGLEQDSRLNGSRLEVRLNPPQPNFPFFGHWDRYDWDMRLNANIPTALTLQMGANKTEADLHDLRLTSLKVETGASETRIRLPAQGRLRADFSLGAASLKLTVPEGMAARIRATTGAATLSVDTSRFPRMGDVYQSPDFETAANAIEIKIDAGAADIKVS